jgi:type I site-specific restriction-modification system R (restriction) subunit
MLDASPDSASEGGQVLAGVARGGGGDASFGGDSTFFLPFNRGNDGAAGNPSNKDGSYPVSYLWQQVLQKDNWLRIFHRFVLLERKEVQNAKGIASFKETLIFPRVATVELKTDFTQSVEAAMQQYCQDRPPKSVKTGLAEPLLAFRRGAVVHFAMSDSDIRMTTRLV